MCGAKSSRLGGHGKCDSERFYQNMSRHLPIVLVSKLTRSNMIALAFFARLGYDVRYMFYPEHMKTAGATPESIEARLVRKGLTKIDLGRTENLDQYGHLKNAPLHAKAVFDQSVGTVDFAALAGLYEGLEECAAKVPVLVFDHLINQSMAVEKMLAIARALTDQGRKVRVFHAADAVQRRIFTENVSGFTNVLPTFFIRVISIGRGIDLTGQMALSVTRRIWARLKAKPTVMHKNLEVQGQSVAPPRPVVYFPHQGVAYGNLFLKDHFYEDDPNSAFHPSRILHVELHAQPPDVSLKYYHDHNIDFVVMPLGLGLSRANAAALFRSLVVTWRAAHKAGSIGARLFATTLLMRCYMSFLRGWRNSKSLEGTKIALLGFDYLFPTGLALALQARGIKLAAVQERFIHVFDNFFHPVFDTYFISGACVRDRLKQNPFHWVGEAPIIGLVRTELLQAVQSDMNPSPGKKVLVLDFHTNPDPLADTFNPLFCWKSNKDFYLDILRLARMHPQVQFVIRGKDAAWCDMPYFSDILATIDALDNVSVNREYDELYVSYKLAANADLIVARQTSLGDEAMAVGIPVLFHDWTAMRTHNVAGVCDYEGTEVYAHSFDELAQRAGAVLTGRGYMDECALVNMREYLFAASTKSPKHKMMMHLHAMLAARND